MWLESILFYVVTTIIVLLSTCYAYFKYKYTHWSKENIPYLEPLFPFGNIKSIVLLEKCFGDTLKQVYFDIKKKTNAFGGFYTVSVPSLMIVDPEIVKNILTKDFAYFHDRNAFVDEEVDPLGAHLVFLKGEKWKTSRAKITATFTSGKMKMMFHTIVTTSKSLENVIDGHIKNNEALDLRDIFARLATDTIGSCAFGLDCNSLKNPDVDFRKYGKKIFDFSFRDALVNVLASNFPWVLQVFRIPQISPEVSEFFINVLKETLDYREKNNVHRKDFLDLLIRLKNKQNIFDEEGESEALASEGITFYELAAHCFVFFAAGFETSSSTLNFCLFELVNNISIQDKARKEALDVIKGHNGELTYEGVMSMKYLDKVFNEVLRKYPPIPMLSRECTTDYEVPNTKYTIKKGTDIIISTLGLQRDPEHYPNPDKFDPERFSEEEKATRHSYTYLPFGAGPRNCIGMRFALLQAKIVLSILLMNYSFTLDPRTVTPVVFDPRNVFLAPKNTFWLRANKLSN